MFHSDDARFARSLVRAVAPPSSENARGDGYAD
jgi:hypothetical protein